MTQSVTEYFANRQPPRKKEPRYLAVIDKDSCTSCTACASVCPVDCIYEVVDPRPAQSYHAIDTSRCIGCQLCYRIPSESTSHFNLAVCPWNAIDLIHNPNVGDREPLLPAVYFGPEPSLSWGKLEEYGYQLFLNREVRVAEQRDDLHQVLSYFEEPHWGRADAPWAITAPPQSQAGYRLYVTTDEGHYLLTALFENYPRVFLD